MKRVYRMLVVAFVLSFLTVPAQIRGAEPAKTAGRRHEMVYSRRTSRHNPKTSAAEKWDQALPTGNGRVGALVFGNIENETIILNHDSLFFTTKKPTMPDVSEHFPKVRELVGQGKYKEAGNYYRDGVEIEYDHQGSDSYHPAFNVTIDMPMAEKVADEERIVNFETGEVVVTWKHSDVTHHRRVFVSRADGVAVIQIGASQPGRINCRLGLLPTGLKREELGSGKNVRVPEFLMGRVAKIVLDEVPITFNLSAEDNVLSLVGKYDVGGKYNLVGADEYGGVAVVTVKGGKSETSTLQAAVEGADEVLVVMKLFANEAGGAAVERLRGEIASAPTGYDELLARHVAIHRELFMRVELDLGAREKNRRMTNVKLVNEANHGQAYKALFERMFDFGRYALICSSGTEGMPANLQGVWNGEYGPPWAADYHNDMNIQMNYWQVLPSNLAELALPYFDYYESMVEDFRTNAKNICGCRGILAPISGTSHGLSGLNWSCWTAGAGWLAELFYDYWLYTGDREFLEKRAVPFMKEVALFYEDFLVEDANGRYVFTPSLSPENTPSNTKVFCTINATMDIAVARELLTNLCAACELLEIETEGVVRWRAMVDKLPPYLTNKDGALKEWSHPAFEDNYEHRHLAHLYPAYPGIEVTRERKPKLFEACRRAMAMKMLELEYPCCWSYVQAAATFGRLEQGEEALHALEIVARGYTLPNLFTTLWLYHHRPPMYQFEAASGIPATIMEMLLFSEPGTIKLLPALPAAWINGHIKGVRARGGFEADIFWDEGKLAKAEIRSLLGNSCKVRYGDKMVALKTKAGESYTFDGSLKQLVGP
ncbi:MAG: glycoside hydrolase family 95 protein [Planctomycetota bacterium]